MVSGPRAILVRPVLNFQWLRLIFLIDIGSITILYSQPVAALQMLTSSGEWKWVRHLENALACLPLKLKAIFHR